MEKFTVVTLGNLNLREGPGEAFEIVNHVPNGYTLTVTEIASDGGGNKWYKTDLSNGWVKALYVNQPNMVNNKARIKSNDNTASIIPSFSGIGNSIAGALSGIIGGAGLIGAGLTWLTGADNAASTQDAILRRRIFGVPHQFIDTTDGRPGNSMDVLGIDFVTNIMAETPILSILPGIPDYLSGKSPTEKEQITDELSAAVNDALTEVQREKLNAKNLDMKFFEFEPRCMEYMTYVNTLCRMAAVFMGLAENPVPGYEGTYKYGTFNWFRWHLTNTYAGRAVPKDFTSVVDEIKDIGGKAASGVTKVMDATKKKFDDTVKALKDAKTSGDMLGALKNSFVSENNDGQDAVMRDEDKFKSANQLDQSSLSMFYMESYYIDFFIKPPSYSESFQNATTTSKFADSINAASGFSKELQFLMGGAMSLNTGGFDEQIGAFQKNQEEIIKKASVNENVKKLLSSLITGSTSVITGANLIFPEIWESSNYSRDFSMEVTLSTPYGTRESIFLNIVVPLMFIIALVLPRQVTVNSYSAPFLVRCTVPGFFSCDMGIVKDVAITKGGPGGDSWTKDGFPTEVTVTINIGDLYNSLSMSRYTTPTDIWNFVWNTPLIDFVGVTCGLNMRSSELDKKIAVAKNLAKAWPSDRIDYAAGSLGELAATAKVRVLGAKG